MNKFLFICSPGGHLTESILISEKLKHRGHEIHVATSITDTIDKEIFKDIHTLINPHKSILKYCFNFLETFKLLRKLKPDFIISTGAGIALSSIVIGRLLGIKTIFCESFCRPDELSLTGKFAYIFSNLFIVHHEALLEKYPKSILGKF